MQRFSLIAALALIAAAGVRAAPADVEPAAAPVDSASAADAVVVAQAEEAPADAPAVAAAPTAAAPAPSPAQTDPEPAPAEPPPADPATAPGTAASPVGNVAAKAEETKKEEAPAVNARLAPGGVVASGNSFPLGLMATFDTNAGLGNLFPGYQRQPQVGNSLNLRPILRVPKFFDAQPRMNILGSIDFSVNNWLGAFSNFNVAERMVRVSDFTFGAVFGGLYTEEFTGITVSPVVSARLPLSIASRFQNQLTSLAVSTQLSWTSPDLWGAGNIIVQYTPGIRGNLYSAPAGSVPCTDAPDTNEALAGSGLSPTDGLTDIPVRLGRVGETLPNGECIVPGRQILGNLTNSLGVTWALDAHSAGVNLGWNHSFLRPLSNNPDLGSAFSSGQNFLEGNSGALFYSYQVPVDFTLFLTAGVSTFNFNAYDNRGNVRFPLFDFVSGPYSLTSGFFDVTVGI